MSNLTGVNAVTLRAWERRYGLVKPVRTASGHRLYGREQIDQIHQILGLLKKGLSISQVGRALPMPQASSARASQGPWSGYRERMVAAVSRFDDEELEQVYSTALALHSIEVVTARLLLPVLRELGRRWQSGQGSVAEEHFFSVYVRDKLGARFHHRARGRRGPSILAACLPDEQHEIGLLVFSLAAHEHGLRVVLLAARTPLEELPIAARRAHCAAVVLSATVTPPALVITEQLPAMVAAAGVPVFVGGGASVHERDAIVASGAEVLGTDISAGVERIRSALADVETD
ncbi:MAG: MerR family transcriptional regulator [Steroidobacteraceae bacterium]